MSFIEKKKGLLTLKVLYLYKPCINYLFSIQGTRCILKVDSKKNKKNYWVVFLRKSFLKELFLAFSIPLLSNGG